MYVVVVVSVYQPNQQPTNQPTNQPTPNFASLKKHLSKRLLVEPQGTLKRNTVPHLVEVSAFFELFCSRTSRQEGTLCFHCFEGLE
jgi:hypothetical protein